MANLGTSPDLTSKVFYLTIQALTSIKVHNSLLKLDNSLNSDQSFLSQDCKISRISSSSNGSF